MLNVWYYCTWHPRYRNKFELDFNMYIFVSFRASALVNIWIFYLCKICAFSHKRDLAKRQTFYISWRSRYKFVIFLPVKQLPDWQLNCSVRCDEDSVGPIIVKVYRPIRKENFWTYVLFRRGYDVWWCMIHGFPTNNLKSYLLVRIIGYLVRRLWCSSVFKRSPLSVGNTSRWVWKGIDFPMV